jgi:hypothetical protein
MKSASSEPKIVLGNAIMPAAISFVYFLLPILNISTE